MVWLFLVQCVRFRILGLVARSYSEWFRAYGFWFGSFQFNVFGLVIGFRVNGFVPMVYGLAVSGSMCTV